MSDLLFDPPEMYDLPVSLGRDIIVEFKNAVPNSDPIEYTDYPAGTTVTLVITKGITEFASAVGEISGYSAICKIKHDVADTVKTGMFWRCSVTLPDEDEVVGVNGMVVRYDGAAEG
jgi:hypothetical protein